MNANTEVMYWKSDKLWYRFNKETDKYELTEKAPERAKKSFELYKKQNNY